MIKLHRLNGYEFLANAEMIKFVESTPDTVITLAVGNGVDEKFMVKESVEDVVEKIFNYKQKCFSRKVADS